MNRRQLVQRLAAAGLVAVVPEVPEPVKRIWALGQMPRDIRFRVLRDGIVTHDAPLPGHLDERGFFVNETFTFIDQHGSAYQIYESGKRWVLGAPHCSLWCTGSALDLPAGMLNIGRT